MTGRPPVAPPASGPVLRSGSRGARAEAAAEAAGSRGRVGARRSTATHLRRMRRSCARCGGRLKPEVEALERVHGAAIWSRFWGYEDLG